MTRSTSQLLALRQMSIIEDPVDGKKYRTTKCLLCGKEMKIVIGRDELGNLTGNLNRCDCGLMMRLRKSQIVKVDRRRRLI